ncbi:MAG TPA: cob(I)yrinic acid a,c-diamide adenosyltransferase [Anaerolineales bacterium]|nr:cob(I)yrinic acid a,c-diamide adenosyltransferase [Anaerolineales bacterium]
MSIRWIIPVRHPLALSHGDTLRYNARMSFYTAKGDDGSTNVLGEGRVMKYDARIEAVGTLDESTAALGLARAQCLDPRSGPILLEAQRDLYKLMAEVSATPENADKFHFIDESRVKWLEEQTDELSKVIEMPKEFILPGDSLAGAALSLARAIVRRAERRVVEMFDTEGLSNPDLQRYLNRLSSLCFVLELLENQASGHRTSLAKS